MQSESISLFYREGNSDKIYNASLEQVTGGWLVNFSYGRRGNALITGTKTDSPLPYDKALSVYKKLVHSKTVKGYRPTEGSSAPVSIQVLEERDTGIRVQLLNEVEDEEISVLLYDDNYCAQQKYDGRRRVIKKTGKEVIGINRRGLSVAISEVLTKDILSLDRDFTIDGEDLGDKLAVFDILELEGKDLRGEPYEKRFLKLTKIIDRGISVFVVETAFTTLDKENLLDRLKRENAEGIVFKDIHSPYTAGRPNSGGTQLKYKFWSSASCIVEKVNDWKKSVSLVVYDGKELVSIGNVTVPANQEIPKKDEILEIRYLYAYKGGSLYQPILVGRRDDIEEKDCKISQLKYKVSVEEDES